MGPSPLARSALAAAALASAPAAAQAPAALAPAPVAVWRDGYVERLEALALLQSLNADLLSHDSATLTLDRWCAAHGVAPGSKVVARRVLGADKPADPERRRLLAAGPDEPVRYRRVRLSCGGRVLSEADNWYVPGRLTPAMNAVLDGSDVAFGRAVQALRFQRRTLSARLLWSPLPEGWETSPAPAAAPTGALVPPPAVLEHRAVLTLPDGTPISTVVETYTAGVLAFPQPATPERRPRPRP